MNAIFSNMATLTNTTSGQCGIPGWGGSKKFHARSVGIEANPLWVLWTIGRILLSNLIGQVKIIWGSFYRKDLSEADVVILYLLPRTNDKLRQKLETELKPGARVVSHYFTFHNWIPVKVDYPSLIYLYEIGNHRNSA